MSIGYPLGKRAQICTWRFKPVEITHGAWQANTVDVYKCAHHHWRGYYLFPRINVTFPVWCTVGVSTSFRVTNSSTVCATRTKILGQNSSGSNFISKVAASGLFFYRDGNRWCISLFFLCISNTRTHRGDATHVLSCNKMVFCTRCTNSHCGCAYGFL